MIKVKRKHRKVMGIRKVMRIASKRKQYANNSKQGISNK